MSKTSETMATALALSIFGISILASVIMGNAGLSSAVVLPAAATLFGSYLGATCAFSLQRQQKQEEERRKRILSGNTAIFIVGQQWNALKNLSNQFIDPVRTNPARFIVMQPSLPLNYDRYRVDLEGLYFLLETEHRHLLFQTPLLENRFQIAVQVFNERSRLHREEVQPRLASAGARQGVTYSTNLENLEEILGHKLLTELQRSTEQAIETVDDTLKQLMEHAGKLHTALKDIFKGEKIIELKEGTET